MSLIRDIWLIRQRRDLESPELTPQEVTAITETLHETKGGYARAVLLDCAVEINELSRVVWQLEDRIAALEEENRKLRNIRRQYYLKEHHGNK